MPRSRGFSMLEMVIACLIFTTISISFLGFFSHHYKAIGRARTQLLAQHLARTKMIDYVAARFEGVELLIPLAAGKTLMETIPVQLETRGITRTIQFDVFAELSETTVGIGGEKNIAVWVEWEEGGIARSVVYRTIVARNG